MEMRKIKPKKDEMMMEGPAKHASEPMYPRFRIELEHLPEAKKWKIGKEYEISMKVKMVGISMSRFQNDSEFEIKEIGTEEYKSSDEKSEK